MYPIVRLTEDGIDWGAEPQLGDEVGYAMSPWRHDDCLQAAIATVTQTPIQQVPYPDLVGRQRRGVAIDEINRSSWQKIVRWAEGRGLAIGYWGEVPVPRRRWIGVVGGETGTLRSQSSNRRMDRPPYVRERLVAEDGFVPAFTSHCLVMSNERLLFDPTCSVEPPLGYQRPDLSAREITYGLSFERREQ